MQSELNARESVTRTLRAQTHEFSNQLHTISGLLAARGVRRGRARDRRAHPPPGRDQRRRDRTGRRPVRRRTARSPRPAWRPNAASTCSWPTTAVLPRLDHELSADVGTVLGNLVDNAVDAAAGAGGARVDVHLALDGDTVLVQVADSGPGVPADAEIFRRGYTHQAGRRERPRGRPRPGAGRLRAPGRVGVGAQRRRRCLHGAAPVDRPVCHDPDELTVLVVDDDFMVASIHTRFVERAEGFRVVGVGSNRRGRPRRDRAAVARTSSSSTCTCLTSAGSTCCAGSAATATTSA